MGRSTRTTQRLSLGDLLTNKQNKSSMLSSTKISNRRSINQTSISGSQTTTKPTSRTKQANAEQTISYCQQFFVLLIPLTKDQLQKLALTLLIKMGELVNDDYQFLEWTKFSKEEQLPIHDFVDPSQYPFVLDIRKEFSNSEELDDLNIISELLKTGVLTIHKRNRRRFVIAHILSRPLSKD